MLLQINDQYPYVAHFHLFALFEDPLENFIDVHNFEEFFSSWNTDFFKHVLADLTISFTKAKKFIEGKNPQRIMEEQKSKNDFCFSAPTRST
jgi:hypothetical protein